MIFLYGVGVLAIVFTALIMRTEIMFRRRGFRVHRHNRDQWVYQELAPEGRRKVVLDGEMMVRGPSVLYVPDESTWDSKMPEWVHGRRAEILERMKTLAGEELSFHEVSN